MGEGIYGDNFHVAVEIHQQINMINDQPAEWKFHTAFGRAALKSQVSCEYRKLIWRGRIGHINMC